MSVDGSVDSHSLCTANTAYPRPFLKWAGGKGQVLQQYLEHFPTQFEAYHEPFLGGGAVFFHLLPSRAVLTDINEELVNVYQCIRDAVEAVIDGLSIHQANHSKDYYYHIRANPGTHPVERAARLLYLNKTCFNGLYRENSKGQFNVPMGRYKNPAICNPDLLRAAARALQPVAIAVASFDTVLQRAHDARDFVYFDPPYHPISVTSSFTAYNRYAFRAEDQVRLCKIASELANRGVQVMVSNSDCPFIRDLYKDFNIHPIQAARSINSNAKKRGKITELLITS